MWIRSILSSALVYGYHYQYDGIGNCTQATEGEAQPLAYHANLLNQYTNLGSSVIPLTGSASADATVTVKATVGETSTYYTPDRSGEAFAVDIPIPSGGGEITTDLEINAVRFDSDLDLDLVKTVTGSYTASSQPMTYDLDGNLLTWDGWLFTWNGENRLVRAEKGLLKIEANYDYMGRRFEKKVYNGETLTKHQRFIYNGYKLIEIRDALNENALETAYFWQPQALDVPIAIKQGTTLGFYQYDGNKNITGIKAQDGTVLAEYTYGPFGQTLSMTGDWAAQNPFRFSSEYHDTETSLIYYNYRHYSPDLGRWLSRDPIGIKGGVNLYSMLGNDSINSIDLYGLAKLLFIYEDYDPMFKQWANSVSSQIQSGVSTLYGNVVPFDPDKDEIIFIAVTDMDTIKNASSEYECISYLGVFGHGRAGIIWFNTLSEDDGLTNVKSFSFGVPGAYPNSRGNKRLRQSLSQFSSFKMIDKGIMEFYNCGTLETFTHIDDISVVDYLDDQFTMLNINVNIYGTRGGINNNNGTPIFEPSIFTKIINWIGNNYPASCVPNHSIYGRG